MTWGQDKRPFFGGLYGYEADVSFHLPEGASLSDDAAQRLEADGRLLLGQLESYRRLSNLPSLATHAKDPQGNYFEYGVIMGRPFIRVWPVTEPEEASGLWQFYCIGRVNGELRVMVSNTARGAFVDLGPSPYDNLTYVGGGFGVCQGEEGGNATLWTTRDMLSFKRVAEDLPSWPRATSQIIPGLSDGSDWGVSVLLNDGNDYPAYLRCHDGEWSINPLPRYPDDRCGFANISRIGPSRLIARHWIYPENYDDTLYSQPAPALTQSYDNGATWIDSIGTMQVSGGFFGTFSSDHYGLKSYAPDHDFGPAQLIPVSMAQHENEAVMLATEIRTPVLSVDNWVMFNDLEFVGSTESPYGQYQNYSTVYSDYEDQPEWVTHRPRPYVLNPATQIRIGPAQWQLANSQALLFQRFFADETTILIQDGSGNWNPTGPTAYGISRFLLGYPQPFEEVNPEIKFKDRLIFPGGAEDQVQVRSIGNVCWLDATTLLCPICEDSGEDDDDMATYALYESTDLGLSWSRRATIRAAADEPDEDDFVMANFSTLVRLRLGSGRPAYVTPAARWVTDPTQSP